MIYNMARNIDEGLAARKFPTRVAYGPERMARDAFDPVIIIERDHEASETVIPAKGSQLNPRLKLTRNLAVAATVFARSALPGARIEDHVRECDQIVDAFLVELQDWGTAARAGEIPITEARYMKASERNDIETWPGVAYLIKFRVPRGVRAVDYVGAGRPEQAIAGLAGEIHVRRNAEDPPEVVPVP